MFPVVHICKTDSHLSVKMHANPPVATREDLGVGVGVEGALRLYPHCVDF